MCILFQGFHTCFGCDRLFTSKASYDSHMGRPVARILYRCHLCRQSDTELTRTVRTGTNNNAATPATPSSGAESSNQNAAQPSGTTDDAAVDEDEEVAEMEPLSGCTLARHPHYTLLQGGIIKASNLCAVYAHMATDHSPAHPRVQWTLHSSRLTVCPLPQSAWAMKAVRGRRGQFSFVQPLVNYFANQNHSTNEERSNVQSNATAGSAARENRCCCCVWNVHGLWLNIY